MKIKCKESEGRTVLFDCPGCGCLHSVAYDKPNSVGAKWTWNGSLDRPTFRPSVLVRAEYTSPKRQTEVCHSYVTDGKIQFLSDCTHDLAGQTVDLTDWECDHEWEVVDDSFDHEYGTEKIVFERCVLCDAEQEHECKSFDDDVI